MNIDIFRERLLELMTDKKMSQGKLALYIDKTTGSICRYLKGERTPSLNSTIKMAYILKVNPEYLMGTSDIQTMPDDLREQYAIACQESENKATSSETILGLRLKLLLDESNINQKQLAKMVNLRPSAISAYVNGKRKPSLETIIEFTKIFDTTADFLLGLSYSRKKYDSNKEHEFVINLIEQIDEVNNLVKKFKFDK